jgi:hypothetical protein
VSRKRADIHPYSEQDESRYFSMLSKKRAEIPSYSEPVETRYFSMQSEQEESKHFSIQLAGLEQVFLHGVSRKRAEIPPYQ